MGIRAGGATAQGEAGHDAFVGEEEQSGNGGGEEARLTTSCVCSWEASQSKTKLDVEILPWMECVYPMHQAARGSGVWPVSRSVRFAAAARLPGKGYYGGVGRGRAEQSRQGR
jgi:hypothetical protein